MVLPLFDDGWSLGIFMHTGLYQLSNGHTQWQCRVPIFFLFPFVFFAELKIFSSSHLQCVFHKLLIFVWPREISVNQLSTRVCDTPPCTSREVLVCFQCVKISHAWWCLGKGGVKKCKHTYNIREAHGFIAIVFIFFLNELWPLVKSKAFHPIVDFAPCSAGTFILYIYNYLLQLLPSPNMGGENRIFCVHGIIIQG